MYFLLTRMLLGLLSSHNQLTSFSQTIYLFIWVVLEYMGLGLGKMFNFVLRILEKCS